MSLRAFFIVYDSAHVEEAAVKSKQGDTVICFDFLAEQELKAKHVTFISLPDMAKESEGEGEWWQLSHEISRDWYRVPAMKLFEYKGIKLAEPPEPILQEYFARLFYYVRIYQAFKKSYPNAQLAIPTPEIKSAPDASPLAGFMSWTIVDAARMVGISVVTGERSTEERYVFPPRTLKATVLKVRNFVVGLAPRRSFKVYTSAYWNYVEPMVPYLTDTELMVWESRKIFDISWREVLVHRIRVFGTAGVVSAREEREACAAARPFMGAWQSARLEIETYLKNTHADLDWSPVLAVFEYLIRYAPRIIADINTLERVMRKEKPNLVLTMASVGGPQHYFFLMATVAKHLGIPSVELQHAGATVDPRSVYHRIETDHLLTYGENVNRWHEKIGHARERMMIGGCPRFDRYTTEYAQAKTRRVAVLKRLNLDAARPVLFVTVPFSDTLPTAFDSYQIATFFYMVREVQKKVPGLQVLFKFRSYRHVGGMREYLATLFVRDYAIAGDEDLFTLLCASDGALCNNSTTIYQILLARIPIILHPWKVFDSYHAQVYQEAAPLCYEPAKAVEALARVFTDTTYRDELLTRQTAFLKGYSFDGHASERVARLLRELGKKR